MYWIYLSVLVLVSKSYREVFTWIYLSVLVRAWL